MKGRTTLLYSSLPLHLQLHGRRRTARRLMKRAKQRKREFDVDASPFLPSSCPVVDKNAKRPLPSPRNSPYPFLTSFPFFILKTPAFISTLPRCQYPLASLRVCHRNRRCRTADPDFQNKISRPSNPHRGLSIPAQMPRLLRIF